MLIAILIGLSVMSAAVQVYLWWQLCRHGLRFAVSSTSVAHYPSVSIVVAAKNEADSLPQLIPLLLSQEYEDYEVIIINDGSTDTTLKVLEAYQDPKLKVLSQAALGKKSALTRGIDTGTGTWIVSTDADCYPNSRHWLKSLLHDHNDQDVILGYGPYSGSKGWHVKLQRYETWYIALQYLTASLKGNAYMGVGRNLAFRKSVFIEQNGYEQHRDIKSGDDDLFIGGLANSYRIGTSMAPEAWVYSDAAGSWKNLWNQKRRHLTTAPKYKTHVQLGLMMVYISHVLIYLLPIVLACMGYPWLLPLIAIRWIYLLIISKGSLSNMGLKDLWLLVPLLDALLIIYYSLHGLAMPWKKKDW